MAAAAANAMTLNTAVSSYSGSNGVSINGGSRGNDVISIEISISKRKTAHGVIGINQWRRRK